MNPYQTAQTRINQLVGVKPTTSKNTFKNTVMIKYALFKGFAKIAEYPSTDTAQREAYNNGKGIYNICTLKLIRGAYKVVGRQTLVI